MPRHSIVTKSGTAILHHTIFNTLPEEDDLLGHYTLVPGLFVSRLLFFHPQLFESKAMSGGTGQKLTYATTVVAGVASLSATLVSLV